MKVLVKLEESPTQRFLITLLTKQLIAEVKDLIGRSKYSQAINKVCAQGRLERCVANEELGMVDADLLLSSSNARWDHR